MITGAHSILYSTNAAADRAFLRDVLGLPKVDAGEGWLIFGLPPAEVAVHPSAENDVHEFYLMCDDVLAFVAAMQKRRIACDPPRDLGWGVLTSVVLPSGGRLGVYEPRHPRPASMPAGTGKRRAAKVMRPAKARPRAAKRGKQAKAKAAPRRRSAR